MRKKLTDIIAFNAPVTLCFAAAAGIATALGALTNGWTDAWLFSVYRSSMADPLFYLRLFLHVLGHAGLSHYAGNMALFLVLAPVAEEKLGGKRLLLLIFVTALVAGIANCLLADGAAVQGASGVVYMLMLLCAASGDARGRMPITLLLVAGLYLVQEVADGMFARDNISQLSHVLGGACGFVFALLMNRRAERSAAQ